MEPKNILSYSKIKLYNECGRKYKLHYIDKLRSITKSSALCFGIAFDKAIEAVLKDPTINEKNIFDTWWQFQKINSEQVDLSDSILMVYYASDFDSDLLQVEDIKFINTKLFELLPDLTKTYDNWLEVYNYCLQGKKQNTYTIPENQFLNICVWLSMRRKGHIMLNAHRQKILPRIKNVIATQKEINLNNGEEGDTLIGFPDAIIEWEDDRKIVFDYKTSSIEYETDAVKKSDQLIIYSHSLEINYAGFFVFRKKILKDINIICSICGYDTSNTRYKKCPNTINDVRCNGELIKTIKSFDCDVNVLIDTISEDNVDIVLDNIATTNDNIKDEVFEPKFESCRTVYGLCSYYNLCHKNSMKNLVRI